MQEVRTLFAPVDDQLPPSMCTDPPGGDALDSPIPMVPAYRAIRRGGSFMTQISDPLAIVKTYHPLALELMKVK